MEKARALAAQNRCNFCDDFEGQTVFWRDLTARSRAPPSMSLIRSRLPLDHPFRSLPNVLATPHTRRALDGRRSP
jgi:hypothetical protein